MDLADRVIFTGNRQDTPLIYSALDVFVLPSLKEAFPMVILESMACEVPVLATKVDDIPWIIEDSSTGLLVEPKDAEGLYKAISEILLANGKAERFAELAVEKVQKYYSSAIMAKKYQGIYKNLLQYLLSSGN